MNGSEAPVPGLRICLMGSLSSSTDLDEGMKNVLQHLNREFSSRHATLSLDPRSIFRPAFWKALIGFRPEVIHYLAGPSLISLIALALVKQVLREPKTIISAIHPRFRWRSDGLIGWFKPDLVLAYSGRPQALFQRHGCQVQRSFLGVDRERFSPADPRRKRLLRQQLDLPEEKYIILHVGHLCPGRGLLRLAELQTADQQVLLIGSPATQADQGLVARLREAGCIVRREYFPEIQQVYASADCYAFPTEQAENAIQVPLSVLEAMACNLPVVTTSFGALPEMFSSGSGLILCREGSEFPAALARLRAMTSTVDTRSRLDGLDWQDVRRHLEGIYSRLLEPQGSSGSRSSR